MMSSGYYPAGSMRGSGVYSYDVSSREQCDLCEEVDVVDVHFDDWGASSWECPNCGHHNHGTPRADE